MEEWVSALSLEPFYTLLEFIVLPSHAEQITIQEFQQQPLPLIESFQGSELLEALFLEDSKPVALIDAEDSELIALRLTTALWPSMRRTFSLSTFALSPRRIEGKDFDLVFVPMGARSRFSDWPGRRIDGRASSGVRHRWTQYLVERVFKNPIPQLLTDKEIEIVGLQDVDSSAAIRIALLWSELLKKLENSPVAILGLLDIVISRKHAASSVISTLRTLLSEAASRAVNTLTEAEAWQFIGAVSRKVYRTPLESEMNVIASSAGVLAATSPEGAIALLNEPDPNGAIAELLSEISDGLGRKFSVKTEVALLSASPSTLIRLLVAGGKWIESALKLPTLILYFEEVLTLCTLEEIVSVRKVLLCYLIDNNHAKLAKIIFKTLDTVELLEEVSFLSRSNKFMAESFIPMLTERAFQLDAIYLLRSKLLSLNDFLLRDKFIYSTLTACIDDMNWLLDESKLEINKVKVFLVDLLQSSNKDQISKIYSQELLCEKIINIIHKDNVDIAISIFNNGKLPINSYIGAAIRLLDTTEGEKRNEVVFNALNRGLSERFFGNELEILSMLLWEVGNILNGAWVVEKGLNSSLDKDILSRNLIVINKAPNTARMRIIEAVVFLTKSLSERSKLDITREAADAFSEILIESNNINNHAVIYESSSYLQSLLFRSTEYPVSKIISLTYPNVYKELFDNDYVLDAFKIIPFLFFDKRKVARYELVNSFLSSRVWDPKDLLITACLCNSEEKIIKIVKKSKNGNGYIKILKACISNIPNEFQNRVLIAISESA
jgi:hypothetical protein